MCGLVGFVGAGNAEDLQRMVATLEHRGPDDRGVFVDKELGVFLGLQRLEVIDVESGQQPMATPDAALVVVFNGELYNAPELRSELEAAGHVFSSSHSDTEVLLHGYRAWGDAVVDRLNGMWAFALLDRRRRRLLLSRDRFGQKPLYWLQRSGLFAFASEPQALAAHERLSLSLSAESLRKYFAHGYFPGTHSAYEGVFRLDAGCNLSLDLAAQASATRPGGGSALPPPEIQRYWSYRIEPEGGLGPERERYWAEQVRDLLDQSVRRRLRSDVPLGLFLSGGLDSSAIGALARPYLGEGQLRSFSIGFSDSSFDETDDARAMAAWLGSEHTVELFSPGRFQGLSQGVFDQLDEPLSDSSMLSYALLCERARQDVTVALGGDAGDELFAGYGPFLALGAVEWLDRLLPQRSHPAIRALLARLPLSHGYMSLRFKLDRALRGLGQRPALWNPLWLGPLSAGEIGEILGGPVELEDLYSESIEAWDASPHDNLVDRSLQFYGTVFLPSDILVKVDRMSMRVGLEVRCPFLDPDLVDCVRRIPHGFKLKGRETKYILRRALSDLLPRRVLERPKVGFSAPLGGWLADGAVAVDGGPLDEVASRLVAERSAEHRAGREDHRLFLWNLYTLSEFIKRDPSRSLPSSGGSGAAP